MSFRHFLFNSPTMRLHNYLICSLLIGLCCVFIVPTSTLFYVMRFELLLPKSEKPLMMVRKDSSTHTPSSYSILLLLWLAWELILQIRLGLLGIRFGIRPKRRFCSRGSVPSSLALRRVAILMRAFRAACGRPLCCWVRVENLASFNLFCLKYMFISLSSSRHVILFSISLFAKIRRHLLWFHSWSNPVRLALSAEKGIG